MKNTIIYRMIFHFVHVGEEKKEGNCIFSSFLYLCLPFDVLVKEAFDTLFRCFLELFGIELETGNLRISR